MNCAICTREHRPDLPFHCVACARGLIYHPRLDALTTLLENEKLSTQIGNVVRFDPPTDDNNQETPTTKQAPESLSKGWTIERLKYSTGLSERKTTAAKDTLAALRKETEQTRREVQAKKAEIQKRRTVLEMIGTALPDREQKRSEQILEVSARGSRSFEAVHRKTMEAKLGLCREAAILMSLKHRRKKRHGAVLDLYSIAGLPIPDLRELGGKLLPSTNNAKAEPPSGLKASEVSAVLSSMVHLLSLAAFYLSVKLPAEVIPGNSKYPLPTICPPASSYSGRKIDYSALFALSQNDSRSESTGRPPPRPRPLFVNTDEPDSIVAKAAKKDPVTFNMFLEGLSLLAWDIAWLCRSQGIFSGTETWEDVCNIGKNLWQLVLAPPQAHTSALKRALSSRDIHEQHKAKAVNGVTNMKTKPELQFASQSHSSAHSFLGAAQIDTVMHNWKLTTYTVIADPLKKTLVAEMSNADWEVLQQEEWDDGGEQFDDAVLVQNKTIAGRDMDAARSIMTARGPEQSNVSNRDDSRPKGTSGWTKLKTRDKE